MVKTERSTSQQSATQDSNDYLMPILSRRTATTTRFIPKAARNRQRQGIANIRSGGLLPRKHSPDGAT